MLQLFADLAAEGKTVVMVTHERDVTIVTRTITLADGRSSTNSVTLTSVSSGRNAHPRGGTMRSPRWQKLLRDLWLTRGRTALMVIAIAVSLFGVGTVLSAYAILTPEISRNYLGTHPASATLELDRWTTRCSRRCARGPASPTPRRARRCRARAGRPRPVAAAAALRRRRLRRDAHQHLPARAGAWPPPDGTMLLERTALPMLERPAWRPRGRQDAARRAADGGDQRSGV